MPKKKPPFFFGIFNYQNPQISAIFSFRFMPNLNGGLFSANAGGYMKKITVFCVLLGMMGISAAMAGDSSVVIKNITSCSESMYTTIYSPRAGASCSNADGTITVRMLAMCSSTSGSVGTYRSSLSTNNISNSYCWCRVIWPAVSYWVYAGYQSSCTTMCSGLCAEQIINNSTVRNALFSHWLGY